MEISCLFVIPTRVVRDYRNQHVPFVGVFVALWPPVISWSIATRADKGQNQHKGVTSQRYTAVPRFIICIYFIECAFPIAATFEMCPVDPYLVPSFTCCGVCTHSLT